MGTDAPVAGAVVTLIGYFDAPGRPAERWPLSQADRSASAPRAVMTTGDGVFFFRDLPAGRYSIAADAFGYERDTFPLRFVEVQDRAPTAEVAIRLWKTGAISGRVLDEQGEPVVGMPVTAFLCATAGGHVVLRGGVSTVATDDRGEYRIGQLRPGCYSIAVLSSSLSLPASLAAAIDGAAGNRAESAALRRTLLDGGAGIIDTGDGQRVGDVVLKRRGPPPMHSPDGRMLTFATTLYPGTANPVEATAIMLGSGEVRSGIDVPIRFAPTVEVSGVVTGPDGPMNGLTVELLPSTGATAWDTGLEPIGYPRAVTDAGGAFRFLAVSPGSYRLKTELNVLDGPDRGDADISLGASQPVAVGEDGVTGLSISLTPGTRVRGRVEFRDAAESPLTTSVRMVIGLQPLGGEYWRTAPGQVTADGTFSTQSHAPGRYIVFASSNVEGWTLEAVSRGGRLAPDDVIDLDTGEVTDVVVTFSRTPTRLAGSITGANGAADANAVVIVFPADTTLWREGVVNFQRMRRRRPTSSATFEFSGLAPGEYYLAAVGARSVIDWQDPSFLTRIIPVATKVTLGAGEEKTVPLRAVTPRGR